MNVYKNLYVLKGTLILLEPGLSFCIYDLDGPALDLQEKEIAL